MTDFTGTAAATFSLLAVAATITFCAGCNDASAASLEERQATAALNARAQDLALLEQAVAGQEARLSAVHTEIAEAQLSLATAKAEAEYQECRVDVNEIDAEVHSRRAQCAGEFAEHGACILKNEKQTANAGFLGCVAGILITAASGGAGAMSLAGCAGGLGAGAALAKACPPPACSTSSEDIRATVLRDKGLAAVPVCAAPPTSVPPSEAVVAVVPEFAAP